MKSIKVLLFAALLLIGKVYAQSVPAELSTAIQSDDVAVFKKLTPKESINNCYKQGNWDYTLLSLTVRSKARKCFDYLIASGVDVNKSCNGYVPALMHAAKYGDLEVVKILISKGADKNYVYNGEYTPANGKTPAMYAEENKQPEIATYLKSLK